MSDQIPTSSQPYRQPKKKHSCWLIGGLGCLGLLVLGAVGIGVAYYNLMHSPVGEQLAGVVAKAEDIPEAVRGLKTIRAAVYAYRAKTGHYPASLEQLVPTYVQQSVLHSALDSDRNPRHVSYLYVKPTRKSTPATEFLCIVSTSQITIGAQTVKSAQYLSETLGGQIEEASYQNGRLVYRQPVPATAANP